MIELLDLADAGIGRLIAHQKASLAL